MNEMDQLTRFRAEVPSGISPHAEELFQAAVQAERTDPHHPRFTVRRMPVRWRLALGAATAVAVAVACVIVAVQPSGQPELTAELLADRAAAAVPNTPNVPAGQWIYQVLEWSVPGRQLRGVRNPSVQAGWMTADGTQTYGGAGSIGNPIFPYNQLSKLPTNPAALNRYFQSLDPAKTDDMNMVAFSQIREMLFGMWLPASLQAEMYHALALIPTVRVQQHVTDIDGRAGVAFVLPPTKQSEQLEIILDASDYHLLAQASWDNPSDPSTLRETAILKEYPVAELGSTQPSTVPPTAAERAAEKIGFYQEYLYYTPKVSHVTPGQWLYRKLSIGGTEQEIWATADDSEQAAYVNGTLQVCERTDPCAASEQWLMPAGPSYPLIYPQYPRLTSADLKAIRKLPAKKRMAAISKLLRPPGKPLPTLPEYPRPLLAQLNTYSTGCADVAGDCNAVNVAANVLTGYGNYPSLDSSWFFALCDVPGAGVQDITDEAGNKDIAFTFPAQDGVTAILVNATLLKIGDVQYEGYVRDGQETLVRQQTLVSGPGVRP